MQVEYKLLLIELQLMKSLQVGSAVSSSSFVLFTYFHVENEKYTES